MTPIKKLDEVLDFMAKGGFEKGGLNFDTILRLVNEKKKMDLDADELIKIIAQLIDDKYIKEGNRLSYHVTYKGIIFNQTSGYQIEIDKKIAENIRVAKLEQNQTDYQTWMIWLTIILSFGALIAAFYYILQINLTL